MSGSGKPLRAMTDSGQRREALVQLALDTGVLQYGDFELKSGRKSDFFFHIGAICEANDWIALADIYAGEIADNWELTGAKAVQVIFGPAYKGIPLAIACAVRLRELTGHSLGVAYDRKEPKEHGEGGVLIGADMRDKQVLILDDVLTAGTAVRASQARLQDAGAMLNGVLVALDRQEPAREDKPQGESARAALQRELGVPVRAIACASDLLHFDSSA